VLTVTVGAYGGIRFTPTYQLAVDPLPEIMLDPLMAFTAGKGNIEMVDARLRAAGRQYLVSRAAGRVAVIAGGGHVDTTPCGLAMHGCFIDLYRVVDQDVILTGNIQVLMALSTSMGEIYRMDLRAFNV
jgi:hypothetical protein